MSVTQATLDRRRARAVEQAKRRLDQGAPLMAVSTFLHIQHVDLAEDASMNDLEYDGLNYWDDGSPK